MAGKADLLKVGPHFYFDTALRTLCLLELHNVTTNGGSPLTCATCEAVVARYKELRLTEDAVRCRGRTRGGYRCQRDAVEGGFCPSHYGQAKEQIERAMAAA